MDALDTETRILTVARDLFIERGYHDTSMSTIAQKADLGKGTLYWHFDSKDDLFQKMVTREGRVVLEELKKLSESDLPVEEVLKKFIRIRIKRIAKHRQSSYLLMDNENFVNKEFKKTMLKIYFKIIDQLEKIIKQGIEEEIFETDRPHKTAAAIMGTINGLCSVRTSGPKEDFNVDENTEFVFRLIMDGINNKGV